MQSNSFSNFIGGISDHPLLVLNPVFKATDYVPLNLSVTNTDLQNIDVSASAQLEAYIVKYIRKHQAAVAYGGYNETRAIYKRSNYFNANKETERNIHLGIDLWCDANTAVFTPLDATVHSFKNNTNFGDYGPTIILKHVVNKVCFYTLYGHLSVNAITNLRVGQSFKQGEQIATLGDASVNGDYPPHLHFQIIKDLQGFEGDYPGVCNKKDLDFYLENCPDPNLLLKLVSY